jgi:hypothetical protein
MMQVLAARLQHVLWYSLQDFTGVEPGQPD